MATGWRAGIDIGGTFTDIVLVGPDGAVHTKKILSSVDDYARAILEGLDALLAETGVAGRAVEEIRHGTTVAANAILEGKGARTGLITTRGFRDVLEIRTLRMPRLYDIAWQKPPPLVERRLRRVVDERVDARGRIERPLDPAEAEAVVRGLIAEGVEAIAISLLHAYANPAHEAAIAAIVRRLAPDLPLSVSSEVLPEIKEYERTSTTVINAYVMPVVARYLRGLQGRLAAAGVTARLSLMQSNGGLMAATAAAARPMHIVESGPAGGVIGAQALARQQGLPDIITFDMGGTTAKAATVEGGEVTRAAEYAVGAGIMIGSRLLTGAGYALKVPAIDLAEVGAGGGSLVRVDAAGGLLVGPESAGATPGPVCYGRGGSDPTVTDANVILGYLNPQHLAGGAVRLDAAAAAAAFDQTVARRLGLPLERAAHGAHLVAAATMMRAIRAVSSERGRDPRRFALFAFGGNGPLFACGMAEELGIRRIIVPPAPGLFSSFGLLYADTEYHHARSFRRLVAAIDPAELNAAWDALAAQALAQLAEEGFTGGAARLSRTAALHYHGQSFDLVVPVPDGPLDRAALAALAEAFGREHERTYGHRAGAEEPVELVAIQLVARGMGPPRVLPRPVPASGGPALQPRRAYFGPAIGWVETPVLRRGELAGGRAGPLIVEEYDATVLVRPGWRAGLDGAGNIVIER